MSGRAEETIDIYCPVRSVSWVRLRDGHILTVDGEVFTSDPRYLQLVGHWLGPTMDLL